MSRARLWVRGGLALCGLAAVCTSGFVLYTQHIRWRRCFNALGRCFDPDTGVVYHAQSGLVWLLLTVGSGAFTLYQLWRLRP